MYIKGKTTALGTNSLVHLSLLIECEHWTDLADNTTDENLDYEPVLDLAKANLTNLF